MSDTPAIRTGRCMCGAVTFEGRNPPAEYGICHCRMCRQWTGSALVGVSFKLSDVTWDGAENIEAVQSSAWAKRAWCKTCGSGLFFQFTAEGAYADEIELPIGLFDDPNGFTLRSEIYVDEKPDSYAYVGEGHKRLSRADVGALMPMLEDAP